MKKPKKPPRSEAVRHALLTLAEKEGLGPELDTKTLMALGKVLGGVPWKRLYYWANDIGFIADGDVAILLARKTDMPLERLIKSKMFTLPKEHKAK